MLWIFKEIMHLGDKQFSAEKGFGIYYGVRHTSDFQGQKPWLNQPHHHALHFR